VGLRLSGCFSAKSPAGGLTLGQQNVFPGVCNPAKRKRLPAGKKKTFRETCAPGGDGFHDFLFFPGKNNKVSSAIRKGRHGVITAEASFEPLRRRQVVEVEGFPKSTFFKKFQKKAHPSEAIRVGNFLVQKREPFWQPGGGRSHAPTLRNIFGELVSGNLRKRALLLGGNKRCSLRKKSLPSLGAAPRAPPSGANGEKERQFLGKRNNLLGDQEPCARRDRPGAIDKKKKKTQSPGRRAIQFQKKKPRSR